MSHSVLLHNGKATHGFRPFTHPNEKDYVDGPFRDGRKWARGWGGGADHKQSGLKAPDKAEDVLQDVTEFRSDLKLRVRTAGSAVAGASSHQSKSWDVIVPVAGFRNVCLFEGNFLYAEVKFINHHLSMDVQAILIL